MAQPTGNRPDAPWTVGRYQLFDEIASGGMGVVHLCRFIGDGSFSRIVAAKRLHADLALDRELVQMLTEEAHLAARVRHPNVASVLDIVEDPAEVLLIMEYLEGETLHRLIRASLERKQRVPPSVASAVLTGALLGLHAAHEARSERGEPLNIVHRDFSPQNILVGSDGIARVLDFGVAKAASRTTVTARGTARGKLTYMSPEQARGLPVDRRTDLFAAGIVLWEMLVGERLFAADDPATSLSRVLSGEIAKPSSLVPGLPADLDAVVMKALQRDPQRRFATAEQMAMALEDACPPATQRQVASWVMALSGPSLLRWRARCAAIEAMPQNTALACDPSPIELRDVPPIVPHTPDPTPLPSPLPGSPSASAEAPPSSRRRALAEDSPLPLLPLTRPLPSLPRRHTLLLAGAIGVAACTVALTRRAAPDSTPTATSTATAPSASPPPSALASAAPPPSAPAVAASAPPSAVASAPRPPEHHERKPRKNAAKPGSSHR